MFVWRVPIVIVYVGFKYNLQRLCRQLLSSSIQLNKYTAKEKSKKFCMASTMCLLFFPL